MSTVRSILDAYMRMSAANGLHEASSRRYREMTFRRFNALHGDDPAEAMNLHCSAKLCSVITNVTAVLGMVNIGPLAFNPVMLGMGCLVKKFAVIDVFVMDLGLFIRLLA